MKYTLPLIALTSLLLSSCNEKGCKDPLAVNYEDSIHKDDGSCRYQSKVIFIHSEATQSLVDNGASYTISFQGSNHSALAYSELQAAQNCLSSYHIVELGSETSKTLGYSYSAIDTAGVSFVADALIEVSAAECHLLEI